MLGVGDDEKMILTVGGDTTSKGAQEMIRALAIVDQKFPKWKYVCKSTGSECARNHHEEELAVIKEVGLDPRKIVYIEEDFSHNEFMPYLLNACDIYAAPSRIEGFGMVQVEAMACGIPVVSIDAMGPKDTIKHGETGFLARVASTVDLSEEWVTDEMGYGEKFKIKFTAPKTFAYHADVEELARYTGELLADAGLRRTIGDRARRHALEHFQYRDLARRCVDILQDKLGVG